MYLEVRKAPLLILQLSIFKRFAQKNQVASIHTAKELADALVLQLGAPTLHANILKRDEIELPTNPQKFRGESLIITYTYKQHEFKQLQIIILRDDGLALYTWAYTAPAKIFDTNLSLAKAMYESWIIE